MQNMVRSEKNTVFTAIYIPSLIWCHRWINICLFSCCMKVGVVIFSHFFQQCFKFTFSIYLKCNLVDGWCCFYERLLRLLWKQLRTLRLRKTFLHRVGAAKYEGMLAVCIFARLENFGISIWNCKRDLSYTKSAGNLKEVDQIVPENTIFHIEDKIWCSLANFLQVSCKFLVQEAR